MFPRRKTTSRRRAITAVEDLRHSLGRIDGSRATLTTVLYPKKRNIRKRVKEKKRKKKRELKMLFEK